MELKPIPFEFRELKDQKQTNQKQTESDPGGSIYDSHLDENE